MENKDKLAKELKDAGFPQNYNCNHHPAENCTCAEDYIPTLSELIEECDKLNGFGQLGRATRGWNVWQLGIREPKTFGETPEEAVAKLWLELKQK